MDLPSSEKRLLIAYGSHTGQAESIAKQIADRAALVGLQPVVHSLDANEREFFLEKESFIVIVVSSTGDGDAPENCSRFVRRIARKGLPEDALARLEYAILGLGDSNYSTFQGIPIKVDHSLSKLGARRILYRGEADDQIGLEVVVEPWVEELFQELARRFSLSEEDLSRAFQTKLALASVKSVDQKAEILEKWKTSNAIVQKEGSREKRRSKLERNDLTRLNIVPYDYPPKASVVSGTDQLSGDTNLRVPVAPMPFLTTSFSEGNFEPDEVSWQNGAPMPGLVSPFTIRATVVSHCLLTARHAKKPKREIVLDVEESIWEYEPGDAFYIATRNQREEVDNVLERLGALSLADKVCTVSLMVSGGKPGAALPPFVPARASLRHWFTYCLDIRRAPGRPLLRVLADSASDDGEKRRLLELCSAQGMTEFTKFIRQSALSLVDVLFAFPSVKPSAARLIEQLPRLMPRPYSMSSCRERFGSRIRFAFSIRNESATDGRRYPRVGVATQFLCDLHVGDTVDIMQKELSRFRFPFLGVTTSAAMHTPLLLMGPGTGISTFLSFLQKILHYKQHNPEDKKCGQVKRMVFFGCRNREIDYIYRHELEMMQYLGVITDLVVVESEGESEVKYVQHALSRHREQVMDILCSSTGPGHVFVCGDAKEMSKDVMAAIVQMIAQQNGLSAEQARAFVMELKKSDRYIEDVWA